jgi:hypothetical protein
MTRLVRKHRNNSNTVYKFKDPDSDSKFLKILTNEQSYYQFILKSQKLDSKRRKAIKADIERSEIIIGGPLF